MSSPSRKQQLRRDSNPQPPDSKSDTLSIAPRNFRTRATDDRGRLVVDAALEARRAPVDELDRALGLDRGDRGVDVLGHDVAAVHEAAGHVLAVARVALGHHAGRLEDRVRDLGDGELLVVRLLGRDDGRVRREHEVDARVGH